jgi:hypothetical protein
MFNLVWSQHFFLVVSCGVKRFLKMVIAITAIVGTTFRARKKGGRAQLILT